ncbi:MAG: L-2-amino-thiazoline-4-carboxylic acid hydrolase [Chloroflexota bacterium]
MKNRFNWLGLLAGALLAAGLVRRARRGSPLPTSAWLPVLIQQHGEDEGRALLARAEARYHHLVGAHGVRPLPRSPALRRHLRQSILPGLAIYQAQLEFHHGGRQAALDEINALFYAWTKHLYRPTMRMLGRFPRPFGVFRLGLALRMSEFPLEGWQTTWRENSPQRVAFDMHTCFYLRTLTTYGAPELTPSFCQIDDWMGAMLPASITFHRTQTLGRGGERCDFCYASTGAKYDK